MRLRDLTAFFSAFSPSPLPSQSQQTISPEMDASLVDFFRAPQEFGLPPFALCPHMGTWVTAELALDYALRAGGPLADRHDDGRSDQAHHAP
ncbi:hypothetical protein [Hoeflea prorocentri]|uniref:Uncharacterized protein n=1 Tax=Hoeflea prorocentri TaxID=1922333 RepID=A0A9X3ZIN4_9HYPH|nr:hypothetical protein [Hoeflea prorocentri]MCY6382634.1 hypothetical protein [Hoeflea prorocentri]MDA5400434.1 hypothetical protein [Hoeflea prorocentri]